MTDFFAPPPEGAIGSQYSRPNSVTYKSAKTPATYAGMADVNNLLQSGALGFFLYNRESKATHSLDRFSFVALAFYAGVEGFTDNERWWSTKSADLRKEPIRLMSSVSGQVAEGLYTGKAASLDGTARIGNTPLPGGCSFSMYCVAYCLERDELVEINLSSMTQNGMKMAVIAAEAAAGRSRDTINFMSFIKEETLWGFRLAGYDKVDKKGQPYAGREDLYFMPKFNCGVVPPDHEIGVKCLAMMREERKRHSAFIADTFAAPVQSPQPANATPLPHPDSLIPQGQRPSRVEPQPEWAPTPPAPDDDLPF